MPVSVAPPPQIDPVAPPRNPQSPNQKEKAMSIAAAKRRRKQVAKNNRHLAKLGRPGLPKKISAEKSARLLMKKLATLRRMAAKPKKND